MANDLEKLIQKYIHEEDIKELLHGLGEAHLPIDRKGEEFLKSKINDNLTGKLVAALNDLKDSIIENANSSGKLSKKIFWLNFVLASAAIAGVFIGILNLL